ncbi:hypothetical protein JHD48_06570 [Sulfurimonas sp. SAG-AH-194-I05]|nr:secretin N-terminal domain-containing protein [Sulfurimonas sp. SAG-AH-194-I05]MDF1875392.1 hypothetical protein [Sulfurimonas sp. SAG-AH-194-I05]
MKFIKVGLVVVLLFSTLLSAQKITINFQNTPITDVIKFVATTSHTNILINEAISGNVNFISNKPIEASELMPLLEHVLMVKGYALSNASDGYYEIVRAAQASKNVSLGEKHVIGMKMVILRPKQAKPSVISGKIKHLASQYAIITHDDQMGILLVSDYPKNVRNMRKLLKLFDTQLKRSLERVDLKNATVKESLKKIQDIFTITKDDYKDEVKISGDENQNALWVSANSQDIERAVAFVKAFDLNAKDSTKLDTKIIFLKNANVEDIEKTAKEIAQSKDINRPVRSVITSNKELNALIISSTVSQIEELENIILQLDIERKQVFVKVQIYEVSQNNLENLGIKWGAGAGAASGNSILTTELKMGGSAFVLPTALANTISLSEVSKGLAIGATVDLLQQEGAINILSEPNLLTVNNIKSTIYVGKTQSILSGDATGTSTLDTTRNSYTREDIGLTLEITPQIADGGNVVLKILINVEDIDASTGSTDKPTTTKRKVDTTAIVQNEDSIIIGGLIRDNFSTSHTKIPLLGDIPFLGKLFSSTSETFDKVSTIMVLTPYIINNSKDLLNIQKKLHRINEQQRLLSYKMRQTLQNELKKSKKTQEPQLSNNIFLEYENEEDEY